MEEEKGAVIPVVDDEPLPLMDMVDTLEQLAMRSGKYALVQRPYSPSPPKAPPSLR
jgi:hypothetical protein